MTTADLSARWHRLTAPFVPDAARREAEFQRLAAAYQAPTRHYHTLHHLANLLFRLDTVALQDRAVVELAVWFHDAVYNALKPDNEARSAAEALAFLQGSALEPARQQRVAFLIERGRGRPTASFIPVFHSIFINSSINKETKLHSKPTQSHQLLVMSIFHLNYWLYPTHPKHFWRFSKALLT